MLVQYPRRSKIKNDFKTLFSASCGLSDPFITVLPVLDHCPSMQITQATFPHIEKLIFHDQMTMNYHISGYGVSDDESFIRLLGETIERYAFVTSKCTLFHDIEQGTYSMLKDKYPYVVPLQYLNVLTESSIQRLRSNGINGLYTHYQSDQMMEWIPFNSLLDNNKIIHVPKDLAIVDMGSYYSCMSTGTATHGTYKKALENALTECIQIHSFMKFWYSRCKADRVNISSSLLDSILKNTIFQNNNDFEIIVLDITDDEIKYPTFLSITLNKDKSKFPLCGVGVQSGYDIEDSIFRAIMESCAIYSALPYMYFENPDKFDQLTKKSVEKSMNLDDNFFYWAGGRDIQDKLDYLDSIQTHKEITLSLLIEKYQLFGNKLEDPVTLLIADISKISQYACFRNISNIDALKRGYYTVRVVIPECLPMCIPCYPFDNHPALKKILREGEANEYYPHPLP